MTFPARAFLGCTVESTSVDQVEFMVIKWIFLSFGRDFEEKNIFNGSQLAKLKRLFLSCDCHEIYRVDVVGLSIAKYTLNL